MKLVSYKTEDREHLGLFIKGHIYNLNSCDKLIPDNMNEFLNGGEELMDRAKRVDAGIKSGKQEAKEEIFFELLAPVPHPNSCREAFSFRQHLASVQRDARSGRDQYPVFCFTNHNAIRGIGDIECMPGQLDKLDFGLEVAIVIGKKGRNIKAAEASSYIAGFMVMNGLSTRALQMEDRSVNPGNDFSTLVGPWLVTPEELDNYRAEPKAGHAGNSYSLGMRCWVNGIEVSSGQMLDMEWTFAEIIERCSYGVDILPGDVIGSGIVGTGCLMELNASGMQRDPNYKPQWLKAGDIVEMGITGLGRLTNTIREAKTI
jgi:fumarylacetoacetate (FAA) hydrolase